MIRRLRFTAAGHVVTLADRRGAIMMLVVISIPILLAFAAFATNVAWMQLTRTQLRTATDASVRAGGRMLSISQDVPTARTTAIDAASRNEVAGTGLTLATSDVEFGESKLTANGKYSFKKKADSDMAHITGIRVTGRRTNGSPSGAVPMLFSGMFDRGVFEPVRTAVATQVDRDIFLVLDRSGSMATATPGGDRWTDLKNATTAFFDTLDATAQDEYVGVVTYASTAVRDEDLKIDYSKLTSAINSQTVDGSTAIGLGIEEAATAVMDPAFARSNSAKTIIVMTDGIHNTGTGPDIAAQSAHDTYGITVHTITFSSEADQAQMQNVATLGGGKHWHADDQAELISVFQEVANNLPTLITE